MNIEDATTMGHIVDVPIIYDKYTGPLVYYDSFNDQVFIYAPELSTKTAKFVINGTGQYNFASSKFFDKLVQRGVFVLLGDL